MIKHTTPRIVIIASIIAMVGCVSSTSQQYPAVPISETNAFLLDLEAKQKEAAADYRKNSSRVVDYWLQPANITKPCKVIFSSPTEPDGITAYWDGRCRDGYAKGLGRAFLDSDNGLAGFLEDYPGGRNKPKSLYTVFYDMNRTSLGSPTEGGTRDMASYTPPNGFYLWQGFSQRDEENWIGYSYETASSNDGVRWRKNYANGWSLNFYQNNDPSTPVSFQAFYTDKDGKTVGYAVTVYRNGAVAHSAWNGETQTLVTLPAEYTEHLNATMRETKAKVGEAYQTSENAQISMNIYKRRICNGDIDVDYIDSAIYGRICLEYGDLSNLSQQIEAAEQEMTQRQAANEDRALRQQEIAANNAAARASQNAANAAVEAAQIQSFNNSMQQSAQNMAAFTNSIINSNQSNNSPSFGTAPQKKVQNCFLMGNIVSCR